MPRIGVGLGLGLRQAVAAAGGYDSDAQAFFDRVTTAGGTLTTTEKNATNQLVLDMKSAGIWTSMKAVYPMVGASAAACAQNLKSSSFTGTFTSGWTFASTGVTGNGTSAYMDTTCAPSQMAQDSIHMSYYSRSNIQQFGMMGASNTSTDNIIYLNPRYTDGKYYVHANNLTGNVFLSDTETSSAAHFIIERTTSTNNKYYKNGTLINSGVFTSVTPSNNSIYVGSANLVGQVEYSSRQCAFASIGDGLTDTQASNFYTAVQTFNQTLNRQVGAQVVSDADAQAYINRVYTAGGTLTNTEANAVNQLVIDMKAAGIWTAMKAVYPMVGSSAAACAQNLKSSSFTGTFSSGWTFSSTGATPNGSSAYFDTGFNPNTQLSSNNGHLSYYSRTNDNIGSYPVEMGSESSVTTGVNLSVLMPLDNYKGRIGGNTFLSYANTNSSGFYVVSRTSSTNLIGHKNGVNQQTVSSTNTYAASNFNIYIGATNNSNTSQLFSTRQSAFASIGDGLTDTQAADFYTCVNSFQVSLSRNV